MIQTEMSKKKLKQISHIKDIDNLERWFKYEYPKRLNTIARYSYLGLPLPETRYELELEAYEKENMLRKLNGLEPLPKLKNKDLFGGEK